MIKLLYMQQQDFEKHWQELEDERRRLYDQRTTLQVELDEIATRINHLDQVIAHLAPLAGMALGNQIADLGFTDAIRYVLQNANDKLSAQGVRTALEEAGFDLSRHSAPMSSIYKVLGRLVDDAKQATKEKSEDDFRMYYRWIHPSAEISDDDIPF